jgi:hypothetical protein
VDREAADDTEEALIRAFTAFIRSAARGEPTLALAAEALLSVADAAQYLNVSTTTVRNLALEPQGSLDADWRSHPLSA